MLPRCTFAVWVAAAWLVVELQPAAAMGMLPASRATRITFGIFILFTTFYLSSNW
jgi:hypothetical protein